MRTLLFRFLPGNLISGLLDRTFKFLLRLSRQVRTSLVFKLKKVLLFLKLLSLDTRGQLTEYLLADRRFVFSILAKANTSFFPILARIFGVGLNLRGKI
jgi:hypothetical protein